MSDYRIFVLGREDRIVRAIEFRCESDQEAATQVTSLAKGLPAELWQLARFIGRYDACEAVAG